MQHRRRTAIIASIVAVAGTVLTAALVYRSVIPGLSSARGEPPAIELSVATWLLRASVPEADRTRANPLGRDPADIAAGQDIFRQKCETCHAYDGSGKTADRRRAISESRRCFARYVMSLTDGEIFYHIRNGIRNTGMPAWSMPDAQIWQLVAYLRHLPIVAALSPQLVADAAPKPGNGAHYVGSAACKSCHAAIYDRWSKTRMANVVRDPKEHPDAIIPDLSKPDPLVTFTKDDIAFVYGSKWKQRYFKKVGDDYFPLPAQWDVTHKIWRAYSCAEGTDWWVPFYPADNMQRPDRPALRRLPFGELQHRDQDSRRSGTSAASDATGPAARTSRKPVRENIVNPARLDYVHANDTCIQCHSQGQPLDQSDRRQILRLAGRLSTSGSNLADFWKLEEHKLGETTFTHFAGRHGAQEPHAGQRFRAQPDVRARRHLLQLPRRARHRQRRHAAQARQQHVPRRATARTRRTVRMPRPSRRTPITPPDSAGSQCVACHMPKIAADDRRRERPQPHLPLRLPGSDRQPEDPERLQRLPYRQIHRLGNRRAAALERSLALARRGLRSFSPRRPGNRAEKSRCPEEPVRSLHVVIRAVRNPVSW